MTPTTLHPLRLLDVTAALREGETRARSPFSCEQCQHCRTESDGDYGQYQWTYCDKHPASGEAKGFPFKVAPGCFELDTDHSPLSALLWDVRFMGDGSSYPRHPGLVALLRNLSSRGTLTQSGEASYGLIARVYEAITEPMAWEVYPSAEGELPEAEVTWREYSGTVHAILGTVEDPATHPYAWTVGGHGRDHASSKGHRTRRGFDDARDWVEIVIREQVIREIVGTSAIEGSAAQ